MMTFAIIFTLLISTSLIWDAYNRRKWWADIRRLEKDCFETMKRQRDVIENLRKRIKELEASDKSEEWKKL